ncbi:MAG: TerB family tellurite resistance protein [Bacteroidales bacterium]|nr:TerB family tellurite resistance protein [Bacteroidales bacterium]
MFIIIIVLYIGSNKKEKKSDQENLSDYRFCILVLLARVMSADGRQMKCELDAVKSAIRRYYITEDEQKKALKQLQSILNNIDKYKKYNLNEICSSINKKFGYNYTNKSELIKILLSVAYADGDLQKGGAFNEENEIQIIANHHLGILSYDYQNILSFFKNKYEQKKYNTEFRDSILQLLARVMKADGKQMKCELDRVKSTIRRYYKTEDERLAALKQFQSILNGNKRFHINKICSSINQKFDYAVKSELIMELLAVAYADDKFSSKEKSTIDKIVIYLQISPEEYESIKNIFRKKYNQGEYKYDENRNEYNESNYNKKKNENKNRSKSNSNRSKSGSISVSEAYEILRVDSNASDAEIKKAYRVLALMYHPDKVSSLGDEAIRQATESMKQINAAWDVVKEARGMR